MDIEDEFFYQWITDELNKWVDKKAATWAIQPIIEIPVYVIRNLTLAYQRPQEEKETNEHQYQRTS